LGAFDGGVTGLRAEPSNSKKLIGKPAQPASAPLDSLVFVAHDRTVGEQRHGVDTEGRGVGDFLPRACHEVISPTVEFSAVDPIRTDRGDAEDLWPQVRRTELTTEGG